MAFDSFQFRPNQEKKGLSLTFEVKMDLNGSQIWTYVAEFYGDPNQALNGTNKPSNQTQKDPIDPNRPSITDGILADLSLIESA